MALQRPVFQPFKRPNEITQIFLGIDFGTSFTKISYSTAPSNKVQIKTLKWEESEYENGYVIPTVLYVKEKKLFFEKPEGESLEVKYFKYSMLAESLINNHQDTKNNFEEIYAKLNEFYPDNSNLKKITEKYEEFTETEDEAESEEDAEENSDIEASESEENEASKDT